MATKRDGKNLEQELLALENQYWQAIQNRDVKAAMRLTDDPCVVAGAQGVGSIDAKAFEAMMSASSYTLNAFKLQDYIKVMPLSDDIAIVAYKVHEDLTVDGKPVALDAADTSTWIRRNGQWRCAVHTEALTGDPFGRDRMRA